MYLDFLNSMKQREPGFIEIEDFVEIFLAENETDMTCLPSRKYDKLYREFSDGGELITRDSLVKRAQELGIDVTATEAEEIVLYCSRTNRPSLDKYDFIDILKAHSDK